MLQILIYAYKLYDWQLPIHTNSLVVICLQGNTTVRNMATRQFSVDLVTFTKEKALMENFIFFAVNMADSDWWKDWQAAPNFVNVTKNVTKSFKELKHCVCKGLCPGKNYTRCVARFAPFVQFKKREKHPWGGVFHVF